MKNRTNKLTQQGFIQIPILIIALLGVIGVSTGGYYVSKTILDNEGEVSQDTQATTTNLTDENFPTSTIEEEQNDLNLEEYIVEDETERKTLEEIFGKKEQTNTEFIYKEELALVNEKFNSLRWLANESEETKNELEDYDEEFIVLEGDIDKTLKEIYTLKNNLENNTVSLADEFLISILDIKEEKLFSDFDLLKKQIAIVEDFENSDSYQEYEDNYFNTDLSDVYSKFDEINETLDNLEPLETNTSNCKYPKDKRILIPGEGWTDVKQCSDGSYVKTEDYKYDNSNLTPEEQCAQRKAGALINNIGGSVDCSDLGI